MKEAFREYINGKKIWQELYDRLLKFASEGVLEKELLEAKEIFFAKLGRAHEMKEELYETASQSFLEWYLFDYVTRLFGKSPAVIFATLRPEGEDADLLKRALIQHWSLLEVLKVEENFLELNDLLFKQKRTVIFDSDTPEAKLWQVKVGDLVQARLFRLSGLQHFFCTHLWLHPKPEDETLKKLAQLRAKIWSRHRAFMLSSFEAVVRTHGVERQIKASGAQNWLYQDLWKKYAQTA